MEPEINQIESHLAPLQKVTPLSKYLAMALFIIMPFIGGWIGYTYAPEKVVEVERVVVRDEDTGLKSSMVEEQDESKYVSDYEDMLVCSSEEDGVSGLSFEELDSTDWLNSTGTNNLFFKTKHPANITIERQAPEDDDATFIIRDAQTDLSASIRIVELEDEVFKFGGVNIPAYTYEPKSGTFWKEGYGAQWTQCKAEEQNYTKNGHLVFVTTQGDAGFFVADYNLMLRPEVEQYNLNIKPIAIRIRYGGDNNDLGVINEEYLQFERIIEQMVREIELMPVSKG